MIPYIKEVSDSLNSYLESCAVSQVKTAQRTTLGLHLLSQLEGTIDDRVYINGYGGSFHIDLYTREDLQLFMTLAPLWTKTTSGDLISYEATIYGVEFHLRAHEAALPDTCKLVEEEVDIPAQPARKEKRMVVKCNKPSEETQPDSTLDQEPL